jgi:hypothetical protein
MSRMISGWDPFGQEVEEPEPDAQTTEGLLRLLNAQADLLVAVATGGPEIKSVNHKYTQRRRMLNAGLRARGISPPFPYEDLWAWYGHYHQHLGKYEARRAHIREQAALAREALEAALAGVNVSDPGTAGVATWAALDERVDGVVNELRAATSRDDLQDVGRRCREILIDAARLLADPALVPPGQEPPKAADAKAWLDLFLRWRAPDRDRKELRAVIRSTWELAQKVTHADIDRVDAYAAAQATVLVVRTLQQVAEEASP